MARRRDLTITVNGDDDKANRMWRRQSKEADGFGKQIRVTASATSKGFHGMRAAATGFTAGIGGAVLAVKTFTDAASDINESLTKNQALFGRYSRGIERYSQTTATAIGVSRKEALAAAGTFGGLFDAIDIGEKQSAKMSQRLVTLAADLASFNNASPEETLEALRSGLSGEAEPMRKFNAFLSETRVKAEAASMGIGKVAADTGKVKIAQEQAQIAQERYNIAVARYGASSIEARTAQIAVANAQERAKKATQGGNVELTEAQKVQARYSLILKDTAKAQGDFAKTKNGDANQTRILKAQYSDLTAEIGQKMLPAKLKVTRALNKFIGEMQDGTGQGGRFVDTLKEIWQETEPIVKWVGRAAKNIAEFAKNHPDVAKLAVEVLAVGAAIKGLRIVSAATGFTDLLKVSRVAARSMHSIMSGAGTAAGESMVGNMLSQIAIKQREFGRAGRRAGVLMGRGMVAGMIVGAVTIADSFLDRLFATITRKAGGRLGGIVQKLVEGAMPGGAAARKARKALEGLFGDGPGVGAAPSGGKAGSLMGARSSLRPYAAQASMFGLHVSSGRRPGSITSSGNVSYHSSGEAIDVAGPSMGMMGFAKAMRSRYGSRLAELIYTPMGSGIKNGAPHRYTGQVAADHYDHVHVAVDSGKPGVGDGYGKGRIMNLWTAAGGSASTANLAAAVAMAESGGQSDAKNVNTNGSIDRGLWQINSIHGALSTFSPQGNARAAVRISSGGRNWRPWVAYTTGAYKRFLAGGGGSSSGGSSSATSEAVQTRIDANQRKLDNLRTQLDRVPQGLAGAVQRDHIQAQIRSVNAQQRNLRGDLRDAPTAAERTEAQEKAGSRLVSRIVAPFMKGFRTTSGRAQKLGAEIEDDDTRFGQAQRFADLTEEDLGTPEGRVRRVKELAVLAGLKKKTLGRMQKRAQALQRAIANRESMLKKLNKARRGLKGAKRAKVNERIRSYEESLDDLKSELHALGFAITDTQLEIGDLVKDAQDVAATPDTEVEAGPTAGERTADLIDLIDARERAGVIDAATAQAQRQQVREAALGGKLGALSERERLGIMGDLREATQAATEAMTANTQALRDLQTELSRQNAINESIVGVSLREAQRALADMISGQLGVRTANRAMLPGTGQLSRL